MARSKKEPRKLPRVQVNAPAGEIREWKKLAGKQHRSLSWWLRNVANEAVARA